ncbi:MAG: DegQ family serine endoprotease [Pseudomonadota bacterium]|nr:DegQ family serine endoprotease [Pseudomonadota bacterium]
MQFFKSELKIISIAILLIVMSSNNYAAFPASVNGNELPSLAPLVKTTSPAVVNIRTKTKVSAPNNPLMQDPFFRRFFGVPEGQQQREREVSSAGSGVIVDSQNGFILTNHHVIDKADEIKIYLKDGRELEATLVGSDQGTDIAIIQIEDAKKLTAMSLGNSDELLVGDFVLAIGNPFGLEHTVTSGIVSAKGRKGINRDGYEDFIQTDASINPGNSGGALINLNGELIGINSAIFSQSGGNIGIGFAIPVNIAKSIMEQILEFGEVKRGLLGVSIRDFSKETAEALGMDIDQENGAMVEEIFPDSAAEKAGIVVGDVIISVDGEEITDAGELRTTIGLKRSGTEVELGIIRDGKNLNIEATLSEKPSDPNITAEEIHPGLAGAEFSTYDEKSQPYKGKGVIVDSVAQNSPAQFAGLEANDIIALVNQNPVSNVSDLREFSSDVNLLVLRIYRGNRILLRTIR